MENGCFTRTRSARFLEQLLPLEKVEEFPSMESLSAFLKTDVVMQAAGDFFQRVLQLLNWGRRENPLVAGNVHVKIYLGAYMIVCWPYKIFDDIGELEQSMINVSRSLIESFEKVQIRHLMQLFAVNVLLIIPLLFVSRWQLICETARSGSTASLQTLPPSCASTSGRSSVGR